MAWWYPKDSYGTFLFQKNKYWVLRHFPYVYKAAQIDLCQTTKANMVIIFLILYIIILTVMDVTCLLCSHCKLSWFTNVCSCHMRIKMTTAEKQECYGTTSVIAWNRLKVLKQYIFLPTSSVMEHVPVITNFKLSLAHFGLPGFFKPTTGDPR